jgi:hypothetical protein
MNRRRQEPASPACFAHEADDAYMGYASKAEITAFLRTLAEAERTGAPHSDMLRGMLPRVRDDAFHRELKAKLDAINAGKSGR